MGGPLGNQALKYLKNPTGQKKKKKTNFNRAKRVTPGKTLAKRSLAFYNDKGLEPVSDELVTIWGGMGEFPSVYKEVAKAITASNSNAKQSLIRGI